MVKKIKFKISNDGEISMDVEGIKGSSCKDFTKAFEEELGEVKNTEQKDSYYQESDDQDSIFNGN
jgi:hypothetical protein